MSRCSETTLNRPLDGFCFIVNRKQRFDIDQIAPVHEYISLGVQCIGTARRGSTKRATPGSLITRSDD